MNQALDTVHVFTDFELLAQCAMYDAGRTASEPFYTKSGTRFLKSRTGWDVWLRTSSLTSGLYTDTDWQSLYDSHSIASSAQYYSLVIVCNPTI